jgi:hypothetical protein
MCGTGEAREGTWGVPKNEGIIMGKKVKMKGLITFNFGPYPHGNGFKQDRQKIICTGLPSGNN